MKKMYTENRNVWVTRNGDALFFGEMTDSHILNAYRMIVRMQRELSDATCVAYSMSFGGEMAQYYQDQAIDEMEDEAAELRKTKEALFEEIKARKLKV